MTMQRFEVEKLKLPGLKLIHVPFYSDARGAFCQAFSSADWLASGLDVSFVQDNFSVSAAVGTLRGMHFQNPPSAQAKLIQVLQGAILDVSIDIRRDSPSYGQHLAVRLDAGASQLFVPEGFAHGFMSLEPNSIVFYKVTKPYDPARESGLHWADPDLAIKWPYVPTPAQVSAKDGLLPRLKDLQTAF